MENNREKLIELARKARENAYSPHSKLKVGACILTNDGQTFTGCNVENVSYGLTNCAERTAVFKAVSEGCTSFKAIAISSSNEDKIIYPCGACRQVLVEFNENMEIYVDNDPKTYTVKELMPNSFAKDFLK